VGCRLGQSKANEAMRRQIEAHGKKLDIMREQHDEVTMVLVVVVMVLMVVMLMVVMVVMVMMVVLTMMTITLITTVVIMKCAQASNILENVKIGGGKGGSASSLLFK
jgi:hypothetical protein